MSIEKMTGNVSVHQSLGDEPNAQNSMTADDLKKLFDKPGELLKEFLNDKIVPYALDKRGDSLEGNLSANGFRITGLPTPQLDGDACTKKYADDAAAESLPKSGGAMTGAVTLKGIFLTPGEDILDTVPEYLPPNKLVFVKAVNV